MMVTWFSRPKLKQIISPQVGDLGGLSSKSRYERTEYTVVRFIILSPKNVPHR